jgi:Ca2+/Na+ antiporter
LPRVGLATLLTLTVVLRSWQARGPLVGGTALLVFTLFGVSALAPRRVQRWSRRHPILDGSMIVPLTFLALAVVSRLSLRVCLVVALLTGGVMVPLAIRSRRRRTTGDEPDQPLVR